MVRNRAPRPTEFSRRLDQFYQQLDELGVEAAIVSRQADVHYLSGYTGSDAVLLLIRKKRRQWLITDARYIEESEKSASGFTPTVWKGGFPAFVGKLCKKHKLAALAYSPSVMNVAFFASLRREIGTRCKWRDMDPMLGAMRSIKSEREIAAIEKALACAEASFTLARKRWKIGMTEKEVKDDLEWEMRRHGAIDAAFETIVAVGANASLPHAHAGQGKLTAKKMLLVDFGARVGFYNSDLTRTLWLSEVPKIWQKRYAAVLAAQQAAIQTIAAGVGGDTPDQAARKVLAANGLADYFTHGLGHGVGLAVHEEPRLGRLATKKLVAGQVVTVEPGVYFPGSGGIRIEDMVVVETGKARVLSSLPRGLDSILI